MLITIMLGNWLLYIQKGQEKVGEQGSQGGSISSKTTTYIFIHAIGCQDVVLCCLLCLYNTFITNKQTTCSSKTKMEGWGVMSDFVSWCRHLLVPFFFMK